MTDLDDLLARADEWAACCHDWPLLGALVRDLAAGLRAERAARETADEEAIGLVDELAVAHRGLIDLQDASYAFLRAPTHDNVAELQALRALLDVPAADTATAEDPT